MIQGSAEEFGLLGVVGRLEAKVGRAIEEAAHVPMDEVVLRLGHAVERHDGTEHGAEEGGGRELDLEIATRGGYWHG